MWRQCPLRQNDPIYYPFGLQAHDVVLGLLWLGIAAVFRQALLGLITGVLFVWLLQKFQRNQPPGRVRRFIHWLGLWRIVGAIPGPYLYRIF